jgi:hypothetical protein
VQPVAIAAATSWKSLMQGHRRVAASRVVPAFSSSQYSRHHTNSMASATPVTVVHVIQTSHALLA